MLTERGRARLLEATARELAAATIAVSDGESTVAKALDGPPTPNDRGEIVLRATFEGREANFAWREASVLLDGDVFDTEDYPEPATKPFGAVWTAETVVVIYNGGA